MSTIIPVGKISAEEIARRLASGAVAILPTETVYGLVIRPGNPSSTHRIFELKGRPKDVNLPLVIGSTQQLAELGVDFNNTARLLAQKFWPGPLTIVMGFMQNCRRPTWLANRVEVAIRMPGFDLLRETALAGPLLVTSANRHGTEPRLTVREAVMSLKGTVDLVVDGGILTATPSTIINVRLSPPRIERVGALLPAEIENVIGSELGGVV